MAAKKCRTILFLPPPAVQDIHPVIKRIFNSFYQETVLLGRFVRNTASLIFERKGGGTVRRIVVSIQNSLLAEAIIKLLEDSGEFQPYRAVVGGNDRTLQTCIACTADMVLMEVTSVQNTNLEARLREGEQLRQLLPGCKIVLLCDEIVSPEIAQGVIEAKRSGRINAFYYSSLTGEYLIAALYAL